MSRRAPLLALLAVVSPVALGACGPSTVVPSGAHVVHVVVTESDIRIDPASVASGDVYLALDEPTASVVFIQRLASPAETPGPLTADDISRIGKGDTQFTSMETADLGGCKRAQRDAERGRLRIPGGCGNVFHFFSLEPGSYAFLARDPTADSGGAAVPMAVLGVTP